MAMFAPLQENLKFAGSELSRVTGLSALTAGKQLLDKGGGSAELLMMAKKMAVDAVAADEALVRGVEAVLGLYEEATRLCEEVASAQGGDSAAANVGGLSGRYADRAAAYRQVKSLVSAARPPAPAMSPEEWHAARILMPVRNAKAQLGLGPAPRGTAGSAEKADVGGQVFRTFMCMDQEGDTGCRRLGHDGSVQPAAPEGSAQSNANGQLWPLEDDEWDYMQFPGLFLRAQGESAASGPLPRYPSLAAKAAALPAAEAPDEAPLCSADLPGVSIDAVVRAFQDEEACFLEEFFSAFSGASDFTRNEWQEEPRIPGTSVCGLRYVMPLPKDVPSAVARLVAIPETSRVTATLRMRASDDEAVVLMQTLAHDAPFGENFRTQEIMRFQATGEGVRVLKWGAVVWVQALAWHMAPVTKIVETKSIEGMRGSYDAMARSLQEFAAK